MQLVNTLKGKPHPEIKAIATLLVISDTSFERESIMKAKIVDIKRFAVHDGDGIRTTVFLKGCPLKCVWCHNPESMSFDPQLSYFDNKCINCGECINVCAKKAHIFNDGIHSYNREACVNCGKCEEVCLGDSLKLYGREMSVDELLPILFEDKDFYDNSGGGVTLSGGECLMQADFCREILRHLKENDINTAVDTCGFVSREAIDKVLAYTDVFLYDIKAIDCDVHIRCTGQKNDLILDNLKYIDSLGKNIEIRIPYVPGFNSDQIVKIKDFIKSLNNVVGVKVLPYHNYAGSKYRSLDMDNTMPQSLPTEVEISLAQKLFEDINKKPQSV